MHSPVHRSPIIPTVAGSRRRRSHHLGTRCSAQPPGGGQKPRHHHHRESFHHRSPPPIFFTVPDANDVIFQFHLSNPSLSLSCFPPLTQDHISLRDLGEGERHHPSPRSLASSDPGGTAKHEVLVAHFEARSTIRHPLFFPLHDCLGVSN